MTFFFSCAVRQSSSSVEFFFCKGIGVSDSSVFMSVTRAYFVQFVVIIRRKHASDVGYGERFLEMVDALLLESPFYPWVQHNAGNSFELLDK